MHKLPKITSLLFLCNILRRNLNDEVDFLHGDKHESLLQIHTIILMGMVKHFQSSQNSKLAMSFQYLKNKVWEEIDFLHAGKYQNFLQVDFLTLDNRVSSKVIISLLMSMIKHSKVLKVKSLQYLYSISEKDLGMKFIFCLQINIKDSASWHYRFWWKWSNLWKVPKIRGW